jgi:hypothetical protein
MPPNIEERLLALEDRLAQLDLQRLSYPMDSASKSIISRTIDEFFSEKVMKALWEDFYYYSTFFESIDGYDSTEGALPWIGGDTVLIATETVSGNRADLFKIPKTNNVLRWDKEQKFKTSIQLGFVTSMEARIGIGELREGAGIDTHYGFYILNGAIYGESAYESSSNQTQLNLNVSIADETARTDLEAIFIPHAGITFRVNGVERGKITTNLPNQDSVLTHDSFIQMAIKTTTNALRELKFSNFEFIQKRSRQLLS